MCNPAVIPIAMVGNEFVKSVRNPKGGDGPTEDRLGQMERYRNMTDEERTRYEIKWAESHGGWGGHAPHGSQQSSSDFFASHGYDGRGTDFDYTRTYSNMPRPKWMGEIYTDLREKGIDQREEDHAINPGEYRGRSIRGPKVNTSPRSSASPRNSNLRIR